MNVPDGWYFARDGHGDLTLWRDNPERPGYPDPIATLWRTAQGVDKVTSYSPEFAVWLRDVALADVPRREDEP